MMNISVPAKIVSFLYNYISSISIAGYFMWNRVRVFEPGIPVLELFTLYVMYVVRKISYYPWIFCYVRSYAISNTYASFP